MKHFLWTFSILISKTKTKTSVKPALVRPNNFSTWFFLPVEVIEVAWQTQKIFVSEILSRKQIFSEFVMLLPLLLQSKKKKKQVKKLFGRINAGFFDQRECFYTKFQPKKINQIFCCFLVELLFLNLFELFFFFLKVGTNIEEY